MLDQGGSAQSGSKVVAGDMKQVEEGESIPLFLLTYGKLLQLTPVRSTRELSNKLIFG
jgi:hypothetical protein